MSYGRPWKRIQFRLRNPKNTVKHTFFVAPVQFLRIRFFFDHRIKAILYLGRIFIVKRNSFS